MHLHIRHEDEDRLIARCLAGETAAFEPLVERYHAPLFRMAVRLLGDREEARDATQSAFLKGYQALRTCDRNRRFFSWIYRILINECLNLRRARRPAAPLDEVAAGPTASDPIEARETRQRVRQAILRLSEPHRDVIVLRYFAEMSYEQVAVALGIPEKTVKSRLFEARQHLCGLLTEKV